MKTDDQVTSRFDPDRIEVDMDRESITKSFQSPLYILNIKKEEIPNHLPGPDETYDEPTSCLVAKVEYDNLNKLLGIDEAALDAEEFGMISLDASDAIESTISDFIPFEDVIKYVSGATKHEKKVAAAYFRGQIRRAYLRGYIHRNTCETPTPTTKPGDSTITASNTLVEDDRRIGMTETGEEFDIYVSPKPRTYDSTYDDVVQLEPVNVDETPGRGDTRETKKIERVSDSDDRPAPLPMRAIAARD
ncbi:hypothetical protein FF098_008970 [Parvularcula flava]|uniref:Uncharacterized protein n=1 Tax=Aquisalinus luteolus TaxID=1566827 RepID=A0A8J3A819_9PROT|nr:hypothetical protein [Aquisalinus luteolus]NHK28034.1 hypothetical protein [Aquisalinus luteolus]GGH97265.1 hypothetical protein GCM10011355_18060 [Aquisalinus luteolus]